MNQRQQKILASVVELYTESAVPVGSQALLERYSFDVSPATIRSDMATLEKAGYLYQPHTSAGRIPTDLGYRYFVEEIMPDDQMSLADQKNLQKELLELRAKHARLGRSTAKLLSTFSGNLAVSGIMGRPVRNAPEGTEDAGENEVYDFGMKELLEKQEFQELDEMCRLVEALDTLDEKFDLILKQVKDGKTTLLGLCAGLDRPTSGSVRLAGQDLNALDEDGLARVRNESVGFIFQNFQLMTTLTALENVLLPQELRGTAVDHDAASEWLRRVGLGDRLHHYPSQLSGGEQQRVAVARAFINRPPLLFADEPTGNLDTDTAESIADLIFELNATAGTALVLITHDPDLAHRCRRTLRMRHGAVVAESESASPG